LNNTASDKLTTVDPEAIPGTKVL